jgi:hypothetical protein
MITALDFEYAGEASANYNLRVANFNNSMQNTSDIGPKIDILEAKVKHKYAPYFLGVEVNSKLTFPLTLVYSNENEQAAIHKQELARISRWLLKREYKQLKIIDEEYGSVVYNCIFTDMKRVDIGGFPYAIELTAVCSEPWGIVYKKIKKTITTSETMKLRNHSSTDFPIFPFLSVKMLSVGDFSIKNINTGVESILTSLSIDETFTIDFDRRLIFGDRNLYENFNFKWFSLENLSHNDVLITANAEIELTIPYPFIA